MSLRAKLMTLIMRHTVKKRLQNMPSDPDTFREHLAAVSGLMPSPSSETNISHLEIGNIQCEWIRLGEGTGNQVMLYLHGGGYALGLTESHRNFASRLAEASGISLLLPHYRLAPESPFPAALDDVTECYRWLLDEGHDPVDISVGGDSAGGGLTMALLVNLRNQGLPMPNAGVLLSPWADLSGSGDSYGRYAAVDPMLSSSVLDKFARFYVGERDLKAPLVSPIYADLRGMPVIFIQVGSTEVLLSDSERLVDRINQEGGDAHLNVWPDMPHVFQLFTIPESETAIAKLSAFLKSHMPVAAA